MTRPTPQELYDKLLTTIDDVGIIVPPSLEKEMREIFTGMKITVNNYLPDGYWYMVEGK